MRTIFKKSQNRYPAQIKAKKKTMNLWNHFANSRVRHQVSLEQQPIALSKYSPRQLADVHFLQ
jgi:hypothetical protein